ncbi:hypothetical protein F511_35642 [Dorcoceras hygrometricum]|uniref:Uncharacterized protein n=1 Tax=Dorcoceras hygrometricum TaxID=472368 RepID=A0A2Z7BIZ1_9LAMI|nr:hypothetical protein F511_35642 [Dorcoceras hygrometricum]
MQFRHNYVLTDPSLGSDTTVGAVLDPDPISRGAAEAPDSDQIHRKSGTSKVGGGRSPNQVHDWVIGTSPITRSTAAVRRRRGGGREVVREKGAAPFWELGLVFKSCHLIVALDQV